MPQDLKAMFLRPRNLIAAGGILVALGLGGMAAMALGGKDKMGAPKQYAQNEMKSTGRAANSVRDYRPSQPAFVPAQKTIVAKNTSGNTSVALNTRSAAPASESPLNAIAYGSASAPLTIIEYGSMTCPHCAVFHEEVLPGLRQRYLDKGSVRLVFRPFFLNAFDIDATLFVMCLAPERRPIWVWLLYKRCDSWIPYGIENPLDARKKLRDSLEGFAPQAGLSVAVFDQCLANETNRQWTQAARAQGETDGVEGTPSFFLNGKKYGAMTVDEWAKILDPLLAKARGR